MLLPGLVDGMLGMKVGDERTFTVTLPQTWEPSQLRGVRADCTVKAKEVFEWQLPEVSCRFAPVSSSVAASPKASSAHAPRIVYLDLYVPVTAIETVLRVAVPLRQG